MLTTQDGCKGCLSDGGIYECNYLIRTNSEYLETSILDFQALVVPD